MPEGKPQHDPRSSEGMRGLSSDDPLAQVGVDAPLETPQEMAHRQAIYGEKLREFQSFGKKIGARPDQESTQPE